MELTEKQVIAIKRKRGELGLSITGLAKQVGLTRRTLYNIFNRKMYSVKPQTYRKLSDWLIDEYATADINDSRTVAAQSK